MVNNVEVLDITKNSLEIWAMETFKFFCDLWNKENKNFKYSIEIKETYFDYGQHWKYTAFITEDLDKVNEGWQSFCPRDWLLIVNCRDIEKLSNMAWDYMDTLRSGKYSADLYKKYEN